MLHLPSIGHPDVLHQHFLALLQCFLHCLLHFEVMLLKVFDYAFSVYDYYGFLGFAILSQATVISVDLLIRV